MEWEPLDERSTGMASQAEMSGMSWGGIQDRNNSWAFMRLRATGQAVLALSVHLPNEKTALGEQIRRAVITNLPAWAASLSSALGLPDVPVVVGGDLNSDQDRQPGGAHALLARAGYVDGFTVRDCVNDRYATINKNGVINARFGGWPSRPYKHKPAGDAYRVRLREGSFPVRFELLLRLRGDGSFDERFRSGDHNPVVVTRAL